MQTLFDEISLSGVGSLGGAGVGVSVCACECAGARARACVWLLSSCSRWENCSETDKCVRNVVMKMGCETLRMAPLFLLTKTNSLQK